MGLYDQFQRPTGPEGKIVAAMMNKGHIELTTWGLTYVTIDAHSSVLDVGCGGGKTINRLAKQVTDGKIYGLDYSSDMVEYSKKLNKKYIEQSKVEIVEGQVEKTGFSNNFFDLVTAIETYYFWPSLPDAFQEIKRILKPKGKLLMINELIKDGIYDEQQAEIIQKTHVVLFPLKKIQSILQAAGFVNVEVFCKEGMPWNAVVAQKTGI
jgi:ubiquinone/menaquinone biosynthesis C-methylase UbiE